MRAAPLALALVLLPSSAFAIDWIGAKLPNGPGQPWPYWVDGRKTKPAGIPIADVQTAFKNAYQTWQDASCAYIAFAFKGLDTTHGLKEPDGFNVMGSFIETRTDDAEFFDNALGGGLAMAAATPLYYGGTIYECDVGMNAVSFEWSTTAAASKIDLESAALHEIGHCMGLDNTGDKASVMYFLLDTGTARRSLGQLDVLNVCGLYPQTGQVGSPCAAGVCASPLVCTGSGATAFCTKTCDPDIANSCPVGFSCDSGTNRCVFGGAGSIKVGAPCTISTTHADCGAPADALCMPYDSVSDVWRDGYCTFDCTANPCPTSSHCYDVGDGSGGTIRRCLKDCQPGSGDCRFDYGCQPVSLTPPVANLGRCQPACHSNAACSPGLCDPCTNLCVDPAGPKAVGETCTKDLDCPAGGLCRKDISLGLCVLPCDRACDLCPQGTTCLPYGSSGELLCFKACDSPSDCMLGQGCWQEGLGSGCKPACLTGDECPVGDDCVGGSCLRPSVDGGCALCQKPHDAGMPDSGTTPPAADAGGSAVPVGCGCASAPAAPVALLCALLLVLVWRRTRCRT